MVIVCVILEFIKESIWYLFFFIDLKNADVMFEIRSFLFKFCNFIFLSFVSLFLQSLLSLFLQFWWVYFFNKFAEFISLINNFAEFISLINKFAEFISLSLLSLF